MRYVRPDDVTSPTDFVEGVQVIFDGGPDSFSLARVQWEGKECFAMRWNIARREFDNPEKQMERKVCVGMPSSHGYPVWFILPDELLDRSSEIWNMIQKTLVVPNA